MRRVAASVASLAFGGTLVVSACEPITGTPPQRPPANTCLEHPCSAYAPGKTSPVCSDEDRCELQEVPPYPFTLVVHVPDTGPFAPGQVFAIDSQTLLARANSTPSCPATTCLPLPSLLDVTGVYRVTRDAGAQLSITMANDPTAFPTQVLLQPLTGADNVFAVDQGLPLGLLFASSRLVTNPNPLPPDINYAVPLPNGSYRRYAYPEPPYDEWLPPTISNLTPSSSGAVAVTDAFTLGGVGSELDDRELRRANVRRAQGLDGWTVWLAEGSTGRRISTLRRLSGAEAEAELDTVGQRQEGGAVPENVDVVVAPPRDSIALPRLQSRLFGGAGLGSIEYPTLPRPASYTGLVAVDTEQGLGGVPSHVSFKSQTIFDASATPRQILVYETAVSTDTLGNFATVLPPGIYDVTIEPIEGSGLSKMKQTVEVRGDKGETFRPPRRTKVTGHATLSDGRAMALADVSADPWPGLVDVPRSVRGRTAADGSFEIALDQGEYALSIQPQVGTGFPRTVRRLRVGALDQDAGDVTIPVPMRLAYTLKDPQSVNVPITNAVVRVFATPASGGPAVEVGLSMTDGNGHFEILLAQQPD